MSQAIRMVLVPTVAFLCLSLGCRATRPAGPMEGSCHGGSCSPLAPNGFTQSSPAASESQREFLAALDEESPGDPNADDNKEPPRPERVAQGPDSLFAKFR